MSTALVVAVLGLTLTPVTADAAAPEITEFDFEVEFVIEDACGDGIDMQIQTNGMLRIKAFSEEDGTTTRTESRVDIDEVYTRLDTGNAVDFTARYAVHIDWITGERNFTGTLGRSSAPGAGQIYLDAGLKVYELGGPDLLRSAGPQEDQFFLDFACGYLA